MALSIHVEGEASIYTGTGSSSALEELGVSVDGVTITQEGKFEEVMVDTYGATPYDYQYFPPTATVTAELVLYDAAILAKIQAIEKGGTAGIAAGAGALMIAGGFTYRLCIKAGASGTSENAYNFPTAFLFDSWSTKLGTRKTIYTLTWKCLNSQLTGTSAAAVLWNTTNS